MTEFPYMPLYVSDLLADTTTLSAEEFGAYTLLICHMWLHGGVIPDDDRFNARICRVSLRKWRLLRSRLGEYLQFSDGKISQKRLEKEMKKAKNRSEKRTKAANSRWKNNETADASGYANDMHRVRDSNVRAIESTNVDSLSAHNFADNTQASFLPETESEKPAPKKPKQAPDVEAFKAEIATVLDADRVEALCAVRRKKGATFSAHAGRLLVAALLACPSPTHAADEMVLRNWTSVKPEWLERTTPTRPYGAPPREKTAGEYFNELADELEAKENGRTITTSYTRGNH